MRGTRVTLPASPSNLPSEADSLPRRLARKRLVESCSRAFLVSTGLLYSPPSFRLSLSIMALVFATSSPLEKMSTAMVRKALKSWSSVCDPSPPGIRKSVSKRKPMSRYCCSVMSPAPKSRPTPGRLPDASGLLQDDGGLDPRAVVRRQRVRLHHQAAVAPLARDG